MSNFDVVTYNAVRQINSTGSGSGGVREVGELMVVPVGFSDPNYVDTGTIFDPVEYPKLASSFPTTTHISNYEEIPMPTVYATTSTSQMANIVDVTYTGPGQQLYAYDQARIIKSTDNGVTWAPVSNMTPHIMSSYVLNTVYMNGYFYAALNVSSTTILVFRSTDLSSWAWCATLPINANTVRQAGSLLYIPPAAAGTTFYVSSDGINWTAKTTSSLILSYIAYNGLS